MDYLKLVYCKDTSKPNDFDFDVKMSDGSRHWYRNNELHRSEAPAVLCRNGDKEWWLFGLRHNTNGAAITKIDGTKEWWVFGVKQTEREFNKTYIEV